MTTTLDSTDDSTDIAKYATLAITGMLFLERIFKNSRFFFKFGPSGLSCGNRTPPTSPVVSHDQERPESTPLDTSELEEFREYQRRKEKRQAKKARAKQLNYNKSHDSAEDSP